MTCARCHRERPIRSRGLCDACYHTTLRNGTAEQYDLMDRKNTDPHARTCPVCSDGGMVSTYVAVNGVPISYICLARAHGLNGHRFMLDADVDDARDLVAAAQSENPRKGA